jgi:hypothetical protein
MNAETRHFIEKNLDADIRKVALQGCRDKAVDLPLALQQIAGWQTARRKLPTWAALDGILYPPHLNMEQCSGEQTARYKCSVCRDSVATKKSGSTLVDLTGGFGVDFSFLAPYFEHAVYVEQQEELCRLARHNFPLLGFDSTVVCGDGTDYLHTMEHVTMIFLDPARRDAHGSRTYGISDCTPDVLTLRDELLQKADYVMLKLSPMLDWRKAVSDLGEQWVREVHIVSTEGECKELLVLLSVKGSGLRLVCVNDGVLFVVEESEMSANQSTEQANLPAFIGISDLSDPSSDSPAYLYEPNASIMKAGCFNELAAHFGVSQVAPNSHLFTSDRPVPDFPGRQFVIEAVTTMNKRELRQYLQGITQANIAVRNFPLTAADLRRRLKLADGGSTYIFATTLADNTHVLLVCRKAVFV